MKISSVMTSDIRNELNQAVQNGESIRIEQRYLGKTEVKTYRFKTGFPHGLKSHSVTAWYSTDFKHDGLYMSSSDLANYISNVNSGRGGRHISYSVDRITPELEHTSNLQPQKKASLSSIIESSQSKSTNTKPKESANKFER